MKRLPFAKDRFIAYSFLAARVLLAWTLLRYGSGKILGGQFGVTSETLDVPLKDVDLLRLSWYLADHQPFKAFIGLSQVASALFLVWSKTKIVGAFMTIPIWLNILVWDMTFMGLATPFTLRILFYLLLTILIIWHEKKAVIMAFRRLMTNCSTKYSFPTWSYILLPVCALAIELMLALPLGAWHYIKMLTK